jgi:chemotaxis protein histidine kinase CheA
METEQDLLESRTAPPAPSGGTVVAFSRGVGAAMRAMSDGLHGMADLFRAQQPRRAKTPGETLDALLEQLGALVAAHGAEPGRLADEDAFWQLLRKLIRLQPRRRKLPAAGAGPARAAAERGEPEAVAAAAPASEEQGEPAAQDAAQAPAVADAAEGEEELLLPTEEEESPAEGEPAPAESGERAPEKKKKKS